MLIAIEGIDGSGKGTQARNLANALVSKQGCDREAVQLVAFPQYEQNYFGGCVRTYLDGGYGGLNDNHPFLVSMLYAQDRREWMERHCPSILGQTIIFDRYVPSNMCHQGAKCDAQFKYAMAEQIEHLEYAVLHLPKPDLVIVLDIDVAKVTERMSGRAKRGKQDIHEQASEYLDAVRQLYRHYTAERENWKLIDADQDEISVSLAVMEAVRNHRKQAEN